MEIFYGICAFILLVYVKSFFSFIDSPFWRHFFVISTVVCIGILFFFTINNLLDKKEKIKDDELSIRYTEKYYDQKFEEMEKELDKTMGKIFNDFDKSIKRFLKEEKRFKKENTDEEG